MALNELSIARTMGVIDRPFRQKVIGLTAGTERRIDAGNSDGWYMDGDYLCTNSVELKVQGVYVIERSLTESRTTLINVIGRYDFDLEAEAKAAAGVPIYNFTIYPATDEFGVSWEYTYDTVAGGSTSTVAQSNILLSAINGAQLYSAINGQPLRSAI